MYPPPNCYKYNPFDHIKRSSSSTPPFPCDQNHIQSRTDNPDPTFLFTYPDEHDLPLSRILLENQLIDAANLRLMDPSDDVDNIPGSKKEDDRPVAGAKPVRRSRNVGAVPRRRTGKKDRHSKICTAQGIRDRRMRLSLPAARKFFDLQDMLGYDKASKTIEWLFTKSKKAIKELSRDHPRGAYNNNNNDDDNNMLNSDAKSGYFVSECEVISCVNVSNPSEREERENQRIVCKPNFRSESREKARARARCRTREKMMIKMLEDSSNKANPNMNGGDFEKLGFMNGSTSELGVDQECNLDNQESVSLYGNFLNSLGQQFGDVGTIEEFLGYSSIPCPNLDDYHTSASAYLDSNNNSMGIFGNWDLLNHVSFGENPSSIYSITL